MLFMNEHEIESARERHRQHPVLGPTTQFLYEFMREVNSHSDGWPYWSLPVKAAAQLMTLIQRATHPRTPEEITVAEVKKAMSPIKAFMTRRGTAAKMTLPALYLPGDKMPPPTAPVINTTLTKNIVCTIEYRCTTPGPDVEEGVVEGFWTGEIDTWGKYTIRRVDGGATMYIFQREIIEVTPA